MRGKREEERLDRVLSVVWVEVYKSLLPFLHPYNQHIHHPFPHFQLLTIFFNIRCQ